MTNQSSEDLVEKVRKIKSREKELIKAKEELFDPVNTNEIPESETPKLLPSTTIDAKKEKNGTNIEIKLKIEKESEEVPHEESESDIPTSQEIESKPNSTIIKKGMNGTNIEIKFKIEKENGKSPEQNTENLSIQENLLNSTDDGIVEKIHEIKQKQKEIKVAKESIINELDEKTLFTKHNEGLEETMRDEDFTKSSEIVDTKDNIIDKIKDTASPKNVSQISVK